MACQHVLAQRTVVDVRRASFAHVNLAGTPHSAPLGRIFLRENLRRRVPSEVLRTAELITTELIANAVLHAGAFLHLGLACDDARLLVTLQARDPRESTRRRRATVAYREETTRRMAVIEGLADESGLARVPNEGGTITWFVLRLRPAKPGRAAPDTDTATATGP